MTYVSRTTAIALKEKGYDVPCDRRYADDEKQPVSDYLFNWNATKRCVSAPDLNAAADWERGNGVLVSALPSDNAMNSKMWVTAIFCKDIDGYWNHKPTGPGAYQTHDLALEAAIVHGLKYVK